MRVPKFLIKFHQRIVGTRAWKHRWKIVAIAPFVLALGLVIYYTAYRVLAEKQHDKFTKSWAAKGESMDIEILIPEKRTVDTADDFFSHPGVIAELAKPYGSRISRLSRSGIAGLSDVSSDYSNPHGNGNHTMGSASDVRMWLDPHEPALSEKEAAKKILGLIEPLSLRLLPIIEASHRKGAWFPRSFDSTGLPLANATSNRFGAIYFASVICDRAILHIIAGNEEKAAADLLAAIRLTNHFRRDDNLLGFLIGTSQISILEKPLWEGLKRHAWSDASLSTFEKMLSLMNEQERYFRCMRQEMAYNNYLIENLHRDRELFEKQKKAMTALLGPTTKTWKDYVQEYWQKLRPRGWYLKHGTETLAIMDRVLFYPGGNKAEKLTLDMVKEFKNTEYPLYDTAWDLFSGDDNSMSFYGSPIIKALNSQASINNMRTAIAIERHHLKHGDFPAALTDLVPTYLSEVLEDVITGKPLKYRIKSDSTPLIYSIGANEKSEGGRPRFNREKGDWAWMYSPPKGFTFDDYKRR